MNGQPFRHVHINKDFHVPVFMEESLKKGFMYATLVKENKLVDPYPLCTRETRSEVGTCVPETDPMAIVQGRLMSLLEAIHSFMEEMSSTTNGM